MTPRNRYHRTRSPKPKVYRPVRIRNPVSSSHSVVLHPRQPFTVFLTNSELYSSADIEIHSEYIHVERSDFSPAGKSYLLKQAGDYQAWARTSTNFLGEVIVKCNNNRLNSRLGIFLASENAYKKNIVTVINPECHNVKILPYQIVEVVLFTPTWGKPLYWEFDKDNSDPRMELLAHTYINSSNYSCTDSVRRINDAFFVLQRANNTFNRPFYEYHFWFRCDQKIASHLLKMPEGFYPDAKLEFEGYVGEEKKTSASLNLVFNHRQLSDATSERVAKVLWDDSSMLTGVNLPLGKSRNFPIVPTEEEHNIRTQIETSVTQRNRTTSNSSKDWDWQSYYNSGYSPTYSRSHRSNYFHYSSSTYDNSKTSRHIKRVVTLSPVKQGEPLENGCRCVVIEDYDSNSHIKIKVI